MEKDQEPGKKKQGFLAKILDKLDSKLKEKSGKGPCCGGDKGDSKDSSCC